MSSLIVLPPLLVWRDKRAGLCRINQHLRLVPTQLVRPVEPAGTAIAGLTGPGRAEKMVEPDMGLVGGAHDVEESSHAFHYTFGTQGVEDLEGVLRARQLRVDDRRSRDGTE